jgi:hypothetical protein
MGCGNQRYANNGAIIQAQRDSIFNGRKHEVEMRWPQLWFHRDCKMTFAFSRRTPELTGEPSI